MLRDSGKVKQELVAVLLHIPSPPPQNMRIKTNKPIRGILRGDNKVSGVSIGKDGMLRHVSREMKNTVRETYGKISLHQIRVSQ